MRSLLASALALGALALMAPPAGASINQLSVFMDDNLLLYRGDAVADRTLDELRRPRRRPRAAVAALARDRAARTARARRPRPARATTPRRFDALDHVAARRARARASSVLFNVTGGAPLWATGRARRPHGVAAVQARPARSSRRFVEMLGAPLDGGGTARRRVVDLERAEPGRAAAAAVGGRRGRRRRGSTARSCAPALRGLRALGPRRRHRPARRDRAASGVDRRDARRRRCGPGCSCASCCCLDADLLPARPGCDFAARGALRRHRLRAPPVLDRLAARRAARRTPTTSRSPTATGSTRLLDAAAARGPRPARAAALVHGVRLPDAAARPDPRRPARRPGARGSRRPSA